MPYEVSAREDSGAYLAGGSISSQQSAAPALNTQAYPQSGISQMLTTYGRQSARQSSAPESERLLFMDDDEHIRTLTLAMLENLGYQCDLARNGEEAIHLYRRRLALGRPYVAVIMDLKVADGMGGEQTFQQLRALDPAVQAVVTSGYNNDEMRRQCLELGFRAYLPKPYRVGDLGRLISKVLRN